MYAPVEFALGDVWLAGSETYLLVDFSGGQATGAGAQMDRWLGTTTRRTCPWDS